MLTLTIIIKSVKRCRPLCNTINTAKTMKSLIIVESPTKAKTLKKYLDSGFDVIASGGHFKDLPAKTLGVDIEKDFTPKYTTIPGKNQIISQIKTHAQKADVVYLASDPDREGEAIAWHAANEIKNLKNNPELHRLLIHEVTPKGLKTALKNPGKLNKNVFESQQARRILDRLVGYKISPILWDKVRRGLSAGRVQSVAVRIIVEREKEILEFKPEEYWTFKAQLKTHENKDCEAELKKINNKKADVKNKEQADEILKNSPLHPFRVQSVKKTQTRKNPFPPFTTSTLQQTASTRLRFSAKKTMSVAQKLFEGLEVGPEGTVGLITYMRTDSLRISTDAAQECRNYIEKKHGSQYIPKKPNFYKSKSSAQDAHEAIRPTSALRHPEELKKFLQNDEYKLYKLIWQRFVASQMTPALFDSTTVEIQNGPYTFEIKGSILKFRGYKIVYDEDTGDDNDKLIPEINEDEILNLVKLDPKQNFTKPPARFNESSLIKELEENGIGRPSTYVSIISVIQDKKYVSKLDRAFIPTELGTIVTELLVDNFASVLDVKFTAEMENSLDRISDGTIDWITLLKDFYEPFEENLKKAAKEMKNLKAETKQTNLKCPECEKPLLIKWGKNGYFLACSAYPDCKTTMDYTENPDGTITPVEKKLEIQGQCPDCKQPMAIKTGRYGQFLACTAYPECKHTEPLSLGIPCPKENCTGKLVQKRTRRAKIFYGCNKYPDCDYATWNTPTKDLCPECNTNLEKVIRKNNTAMLCPNCAYSIKLEED